MSNARLLHIRRRTIRCSMVARTHEASVRLDQLFYLIADQLRTRTGLTPARA